MQMFNTFLLQKASKRGWYVISRPNLISADHPISTLTEVFNFWGWFLKPVHHRFQVQHHTDEFITEGLLLNQTEPLTLNYKWHFSRKKSPDVTLLYCCSIVLLIFELFQFFSSPLFETKPSKKQLFTIL